MSQINIQRYTDLRTEVSLTFLLRLRYVHGLQLTNSGVVPRGFCIDDHESACLTVQLWVNHQIIIHVPSIQCSHICLKNRTHRNHPLNYIRLSWQLAVRAYVMRQSLDHTSNTFPSESTMSGCRMFRRPASCPARHSVRWKSGTDSEKQTWNVEHLFFSPDYQFIRV